MFAAGGRAVGTRIEAWGDAEGRACEALCGWRADTRFGKCRTPCVLLTMTELVRIYYGKITLFGQVSI